MRASTTEMWAKNSIFRANSKNPGPSRKTHYFEYKTANIAKFVAPIFMNEMRDEYIFNFGARRGNFMQMLENAGKLYPPHIVTYADFIKPTHRMTLNEYQKANNNISVTEEPRAFNITAKKSRGTREIFYYHDNQNEADHKKIAARMAYMAVIGPNSHILMDPCGGMTMFNKLAYYCNHQISIVASPEFYEKYVMKQMPRALYHSFQEVDDYMEEYEEIQRYFD